MWIEIAYQELEAGISGVFFHSTDHTLEFGGSVPYADF